MSKRIITSNDYTFIQNDALSRRMLHFVCRLYGTEYPEELNWYAVIIANDNRFEGF